MTDFAVDAALRGESGLVGHARNVATNSGPSSSTESGVARRSTSRRLGSPHCWTASASRAPSSPTRADATASHSECGLFDYRPPSARGAGDGRAVYTGFFFRPRTAAESAYASAAPNPTSGRGPSDIASAHTRADRNAQRRPRVRRSVPQARFLRFRSGLVVPSTSGGTGTA